MPTGTSGEKKALYVRFSIIAVVGFGLGFLGRPYFQDATGDTVELRLNNAQYRYINPLLMSDTSDGSEFRGLAPMKDKINDLLGELKHDKKIDEASVYYRRLNGGDLININETARFSPASMLKVVVMMAYFKKSETDPAVLSEILTYTGERDTNQAEHWKPSKAIEAGKAYPVSELIEYMIMYSDNNAADLLVNNIDEKTLNGVYTDLGMRVPEATYGLGDFTAKEYASFARVLYDATYLNRELSDRALGIMTRTDFKNGIVAGTPAEVTVAHKFGERITVDPAGRILSYELHNCGIVYYPKTPYLLCIMTKGKQDKAYADLEDAIKQIAWIAYSETARSNN